MLFGHELRKEIKVARLRCIEIVCDECHDNSCDAQVAQVTNS